MRGLVLRRGGPHIFFFFFFSFFGRVEGRGVCWVGRFTFSLGRGDMRGRRVGWFRAFFIE